MFGKLKKFIKTAAFVPAAFALALGAAACSVERRDVPAPDYYEAAYGAEPGHAFRTVTYRDVLDMVSEDGTPDGDYPVLIASPRDGAARAVMADINAAARARSIGQIYVLDPNLDGGMSKEIIAEYTAKTDAAATSDGGLISEGTHAGKVGYRVGSKSFIYDDLNVFGYKQGSNRTTATVTALIKNIEGKLGGAEINSVTPNLLLIGKSAADDGKNVSVLKRQIAPDKSNLDAFFADAGETPLFDPFTVRKAVTGLEENDYFQSANYGELLYYLSSAPGDNLVLLGGLWCTDTQKLFVPIHAGAAAAGVGKKIYMFDPRLDGTNSYSSIRYNDDGVEDGANFNGRTGYHAALYAYLSDNYFRALTASRWNVENSVTRAETRAASATATPYTVFGVSDYYKICIPNLILFNGEADSGIIDSFEAELNTAGAYGGTLAERTEYAAGCISDLLLKFGVTEKLLADKFTVKCELNLNGTVYKAEKGKQWLAIRSFYDENSLNAAKEQLGGAFYLTAGMNAVYYFTLTNDGKLPSAALRFVLPNGILNGGGHGGVPSAPVNENGGGVTTDPCA